MEYDRADKEVAEMSKITVSYTHLSYNEDRGASYLYSYPYDKISYVFVTKKGGKEIKSFEDAAGLSFEGGTGISVSNAVEAWNEKNPDKAINITSVSYTHLDVYKRQP